MRKRNMVRVGTRSVMLMHSGPRTARRGLHGGLLKDDEGHGGGGGQGDSGQGGNNGGGNGGDSNTQGGGQNNNGQEFNAEGFWNSPEPEGGNSGESQGPTDQEFGQSLLQGITQYQGGAVFDAETASQIAEGNLDGVNQRMQQMQQGVLRQSLIMMSQILQRFESQMEGRINGAITQNSTQRDDTSMLAEAFPSYGQAAMKPVINGVFQQSLRHTKGDRKAALEMTRGMLRSMGQLGGSDMGIQTPPNNPDDFQSNGPSSLVQELLSMR